MSFTMTSSAPRNENFIAPITASGQVLLNGGIAMGPVIGATTGRKDPLYDPPQGQYIDMVSKVRVADVVYRFVDDYDRVQTGFERTSTLTVTGLSSLNGQGYRSDEKNMSAFMRRIQPMGLAFMENDKNGSSVFNIHTGGLYTIVNLSNQYIGAGDWLMAYAPRRAEVKEGGRGEDADRNGVVTLWLIPYRPEIHQITPHGIHTCLIEGLSRESDMPRHDMKTYIADYEHMCNAYLDSLMIVGMVYTELFLGFAQGGGGVGAGVLERAVQHQDFLATVGHGDFMDRTKLDIVARERMIDGIFVSALGSKYGQGAWSFPGTPPGKGTGKCHWTAHVQAGRIYS